SRRAVSGWEHRSPPAVQRPRSAPGDFVATTRCYFASRPLAWFGDYCGSSRSVTLEERPWKERGMSNPGRECGIREQSRLLRRSLADRATLELARASDVRSGMTRAVPMLRREGAAERVEWWSLTGDGGSARLEAA